jgi:hypothetical protein
MCHPNARLLPISDTHTMHMYTNTRAVPTYAIHTNHAHSSTRSIPTSDTQMMFIYTPTPGQYPLMTPVLCMYAHSANNQKVLDVACRCTLELTPTSSQYPPTPDTHTAILICRPYAYRPVTLGLTPTNPW